MTDSTSVYPKLQDSEDLVQVSPQWKIELLYDSECPLCMREVRFIQKKDRGREHIHLVDISSLSYRPEDHCGISYQEAMGRIHGILPNGDILKNVEVFRFIYEEIGLGWVYGITKIRFIERLFNGVYEIWANWRLTLTGRPPIEVILAERQTNLAQEEQSRCRMAENDFFANI